MLVNWEIINDLVRSFQVESIHPLTTRFPELSQFPRPNMFLELYHKLITLNWPKSSQDIWLSSFPPAAILTHVLSTPDFSLPLHEHYIELLTPTKTMPEIVSLLSLLRHKLFQTKSILYDVSNTCSIKKFWELTIFATSRQRSSWPLKWSSHVLRSFCVLNRKMSGGTC